MRSVAWQCIADRANGLVFYPSVETVGGSLGLLFRLRGDQRGWLASAREIVERENPVSSAI